MFKTLAVATLATGSALQTNDFYESKFYSWMQEHDIQFKNGAEFVQRLAIFRENLDYVLHHNAQGTTYTLGLNAYSHLTSTEFADFFHLGAVRPPMLRRSSATVHSAPKDMSAVPASVDWTTVKNVVTPVKDQGNCGSCWSFSATGAMEGAYGIKTGSQACSTGFSEQELVSCDNVDAGCNGGWMDDAFAFAMKSGGLPTEDNYPYTSGKTGQSGSCESGHSMVSGSAPKGYTDVTAGSVSAMTSAVAQQPVAIAIQANQKDFQMYQSGVMTGTCGQRLDHGVLNVGYGTMDGTDYWKVKNSWGTGWGMGGYILIEKSDADKCGVLDAASYPTY